MSTAKKNAKNNMEDVQAELQKLITQGKMRISSGESGRG